MHASAIKNYDGEYILMKQNQKRFFISSNFKNKNLNSNRKVDCQISPSNE